MPAPTLTAAEVRGWEGAAWAAGVSQQSVIQQVGSVLARRLKTLQPQPRRVLILAGKGHNGDDARAMVPHLNGINVSLHNVADPQASLAPVAALLAERPDWVVDGLFGIGLNRPMNSGWQDLIGAINASQLPVFAVDIPSGLNADDGLPQPVAVRAALTVAVGVPKPGLLALVAADTVGRLLVEPDIGLGRPPAGACRTFWTLDADFLDFPASRSVSVHKGAFGHLAVIAGSLGWHGAAVLAARAAMRAKAGLVTLLTAPETYLPVACQLQSAMVRPWDSPCELPRGASAVLAGPGLANPDLPERIREWVRELWLKFAGPMVADASALDWLPPGSIEVPAPRVITPHPGEAARLLSCAAADIQTARTDALKELSEKFGNCWVVLKGHLTLIGRSDGWIGVNGTGNPQLAQGGSGDVLAGFIGGLLAQPLLNGTSLSLAPTPQLDDSVPPSAVGRQPQTPDAAARAFPADGILLQARDAESAVQKVLRFACWRHGAAADELTRRNWAWTPDELPEAMGHRF